MRNGKKPAFALCLLCLGAWACSPARAERSLTESSELQQSEVRAPQVDGRSSVRSELVRRSVRLEILGDFPEDVIPAIEAALRKQLQVQVLPTVRRPLPDEAYYPPRKRYRADKLLKILEREQPPKLSVLGMTEVDISTTKGRHQDWGVFGLGALGGTSAVISTFRLRRDRPGAELYRFRVVSTAAHEVGHMLGLSHCSEPHCLMNDAEGSIKTVDTSSGELGPACQAQLDRLAPANASPLP